MEFITERESIVLITFIDITAQTESISLIFNDEEIVIRFSCDDGEWTKCDVTVNHTTKITAYVLSPDKICIMDAASEYDLDIILDFLSFVFNIRVILDD